METSKSVKKAILVSCVSAATSVLVTYAGQRLLTKMAERKQFATTDKKLTMALRDSMDCSDPVAKY